MEEAGSEWVDRFGPLPPAARALLDIARLRVEALRVGLTEVVTLRREVRMAPVSLTASQEVRLERLAPQAIVPRRRVVHPHSAGGSGRGDDRFSREDVAPFRRGTRSFLDMPPD